MRTSPTPIIVIHGGAGVPYNLDDETRIAAQEGLLCALNAGFGLLEDGKSALDAVEAAVRAMEDDPTFNAGVGAALTSEGHVEHDASIMDGASRRAGCITGTRRIRNPITLARRVLEVSPHVCLSAEGAELFAADLGVAFVDPGIFVTRRRQDALRRIRSGAEKFGPVNEQDLHGTVGAIALDTSGHLAAATSTGGRTNKWPGRVGDSAIVGAGTYADDRTVAVSCTGNGEIFMRCVTAHRISSLVELQNAGIAAATSQAIAELEVLGGTGGIVAIDAQGNFAMPFNTHGMYRGVRNGDGLCEVAIF